MKTIVLGLGISGLAVADYLLKRGEEVYGVDAKQKSGLPFPVLSDRCSPSELSFDLLIKSPGIVPSHPWVRYAHESGIKILGEIDLALKELKHRRKKLIAITGSNGKTTTTEMCVHFLQTSGVSAIAAGNIGTPLINHIDTPSDVIVVELSSFQLQQIEENRCFERAAILNITPNHLDYHTDFQEYTEAKLRLLTCIKEKGILYLGNQVIEKCGQRLKLLRYQNLEDVKEKIAEILPLSYRKGSTCLFPHDVENAAAAYALADVTLQSLQLGLETFVKPPHRLEWIAATSKAIYVNDSKATSVDAVIKAVHAVPPPIHLIAGGVDKGGLYCDWIPHFKNKVLKVFALGEAAHRIKCELGSELEVEMVVSMEEGVRRASHSSSQVTVLLSPGCSSYDQFRDYQHRGETFRQIVGQLVEEKL